MSLNVQEIKGFRAADKSYKKYDSRGLLLLVKPNGPAPGRGVARRLSGPAALHLRIEIPGLLLIAGLAHDPPARIALRQAPRRQAAN